MGESAEEVERMDSEIRTVGNIDQVSADILQKFDYAALGHIHKPMKAGGEFYRYCGTPLACSVSEAGQNKGIIMVDIKQKGRNHYRSNSTGTAAPDKSDQGRFRECSGTAL